MQNKKTLACVAFLLTLATLTACGGLGKKSEMTSQDNEFAAEIPNLTTQANEQTIKKTCHTSFSITMDMPVQYHLGSTNAVDAWYVYGQTFYNIDPNNSGDCVRPNPALPNNFGMGGNMHGSALPAFVVVIGDAHLPANLIASDFSISGSEMFQGSLDQQTFSLNSVCAGTYTFNVQHAQGRTTATGNITVEYLEAEGRALGKTGGVQENCPLWN